MQFTLNLDTFRNFTDENGTAYEPWTDGHSLGWKLTKDGEIRYVYLNPSIGEGNNDGSASTVFVYEGPAGDSSPEDGPYVHFDVFPAAQS